MTRIPPAPGHSYEAVFGSAATPTLQVYANAPQVARAVTTLGEALTTQTLLPFRLIELVRLRVAFHNQCRVCMARRYTDSDGSPLDEGLVCSLERPQEAPELTEAERAALAFADQLATDHLSITDTTFDELRLHFSDAELMDLGFHVAWFVGFGRLNAALDLDPPEPAQPAASARPDELGTTTGRTA
jgi:alkylhydroperoxidase family enzyme